MISSAPVSSNAHRYWVKISAASPCDVAAALACARPVNPVDRDVADAGDQQNAEADADDDRRDALSANGFHQRLGGVDADQHQHEQEQHHHRAGVDHHLHDAEEQRVLGDVEHRQRDHRAWPGTSPSTPPSARPPRRSRRPPPRRRAPRTAPPRWSWCARRRRRRAPRRARPLTVTSSAIGLDVAEVVVLVGAARRHRVRRRLHPRLQRCEQLVLAPDQVGAVVVGHLVVVGHRQRAGGAGLDAQAAADAAQIVDLVDAAVALAGRKPFVLGVVGALDVDGVGGAGPGAQLAADALLQPVGIPVELVAAVVALARPGPASPDTPR